MYSIYLRSTSCWLIDVFDRCSTLTQCTTLCPEKPPLLFSFITSSQINQFAPKFQHLWLNEYWLYMFKNSLSICYIFFAIDDIIVTSVNTYTSIMGITLKISTWSNLYEKIRDMEQSDCLNCFLTKTEVLMDWTRWSKKLTTQVLCGQCKVNRYPIRWTTVPVFSIFFGQRFQSTKSPRLQFLLRNMQSLCSIFLIFS